MSLRVKLQPEGATRAHPLRQPVSEWPNPANADDPEDESAAGSAVRPGGQYYTGPHPKIEDSPSTNPTLPITTRTLPITTTSIPTSTTTTPMTIPPLPIMILHASDYSGSIVTPVKSENAVSALLVRSASAHLESQPSALGHLYSHFPVNKQRARGFWVAVRLTHKVARQSRVHEISSDADPRPYATVIIGHEEIRGLLDSGATISCFGQDACSTMERLNIKSKIVA